MKHIPNEKQIQELLENSLPKPGQRLDQRLSAAPWTPRMIARRRFISGTISVAMTIALLIAVTPQGRAFAQSVLRYFVQVETVMVPTAEAELVPVESNVKETEPVPTIDEGCGTIVSPGCSVDEVRTLVGFPVRELDVNPTQLHLVGATTVNQNGVALAYQGEAGTLNFTQIPVDSDMAQQWRVGSSAVVEVVVIGSATGEYVRGGWFGLGLVEEGAVNWEDTAALQTLRWEEDGIQYTLWFASAKTSDGSPGLDKSVLVEMAANMKTSYKNDPVPNQTMQEVEALTGFIIAEPGNMPAGFTFTKAVYSSQYNAACSYYHYGMDENNPAVTLFESNWGLPTIEDIQTKAFFGNVEVEIAAEVETVALNGADGGMATLITTGIEPSKVCGGEETRANRALLWQSNGKSYILFAFLDQLDGRSFLTKLEMRQLAEGLNGIPSDTVEVDPERMPSVESAEMSSGFDIKAPALMLADLRFDHVTLMNYGPYRAGDGEVMVALFYAGQPVGDGRTYKLLIMQTFDPTNTLENLALAGGYENTTVNGQPAIYRQDCWDMTSTGGDVACKQFLTWFENGVQYDIEVYLPASLPKETLIAIAESMR
jgi:hypothetical protein